jgi:hypothetical protein
MTAKFSSPGLASEAPPGAGRPFKMHLVATNSVVARLVPSTIFHWAALVYQSDPAPADGNRQRIAVHLHILRCSNKYLGTPEPLSVTETIVPEDIVANDRFVRDLVKDRKSWVPRSAMMR